LKYREHQRTVELEFRDLEFRKLEFHKLEFYDGFFHISLIYPELSLLCHYRI
jgi:hypothetical protein